MASYQYLTVAGGLGIAKLNFTCPIGVGHAQCEFAFKQEGLGPINALSTATEIRGTFASRLMGYMSSLASLTQCEVTIYDGTFVQQATTNATPVSGGAGSNPVSPAISLLFHKSTGLIGRENRGRMYYPYLSSGLLYQPDQVSTGTKTAVDASISSWFADLNSYSGVILPWIIRKTQDPLLNHNVAVTSMVSETMLATQRRRQRKAAHK